MDQETRKKVEQRAREILDNPQQHRERWMRRMAERIARREVIEEEQRARREDPRD
jgi:hypothetical protein